MEMVKGLLEMLETRTMKFDVSKVPSPESQRSISCAFLMEELEKEAPNLRVTVRRTAEGAVFVGPDANRTYSAAEARALAGRLYREATVK